MTTWSHLGLYLTDELRTDAALEKFNKKGDTAKKQKEIQLLEECLKHWDQVFSWEMLRPQVVWDIQLARKTPQE